jgi:hypothetical protein
LEQLRTQSILFAKLFVIMGITWIGECIHVQLHGDHSHLEDCSFISEVNGWDGEMPHATMPRDIMP